MKKLDISFDSFDLILATSMFCSFFTDKWLPTLILFLLYTLHQIGRDKINKRVKEICINSLNN